MGRGSFGTDVGAGLPVVGRALLLANAPPEVAELLLKLRVRGLSEQDAHADS